MSVPKVTTGDDISLQVTLKKNAATFAISDTAIVKAALIHSATGDKLTSEVTQSKDTSGADWPNSLVVVEIPSSETESSTRTGVTKVEIQVADPSKLTWFVTVDLIQGNIA